ncbi:MAG TPA: VWA domain-containing protein [Dehalococcoidia bacterium]|nr:VWA domain-containing protein [Dehalococcoidia bacterium]
MQNWPLPFLAILAVFSLLFAAPAAAGPSGAEITSVDTMQYPLVTLSVPIVDEAGHPVTGLAAENFSISQNGAPATIESVEAAVDTDVGAGVVVVIDISGSMAGAPIEAAKAAAISFVGSLSSADLVAVVAFSDSVQLVQPFTADKAAATAVIQGLSVFGDTALFGAANQSVDFALQSGLTRQAVVLLSDGANDDPNGGPPPDLVLAHVAEVGIPVFAVALGAGADATFTQQLADASGGAAYRANTPSELSGLYQEMAQRLNSEYIIRYRAPHGVGEQTISVTAEANGARYAAETRIDVLWSATSEEGGPRVRLPEFKPGSTVDNDLLMAPAIESAAALTGVTMSIDGTSRQVLGTEPYEFAVQPAALAVGRHAIAFEARDENGGVGLFEVVVEIPDVAPKLSITPEPGATLKPGDPIAIEVLAQGASADSVVVTADGEEHQLSEPPFVFEVPGDLAEGPQQIEVAAELDGDEVTAGYEFDLAPAGSSGNTVVYAAAGLLAVLVLVAAYVLLRRRRRQRQLRKEQDYVPGMRDGLEPLVAAPASEPREFESRGLRARLRVTDGPLAGRIFFLGNGSGVIGTSADATVQIDLAGWETAPELIRIWSRDDKYMFHQVAPGNVTVAGREARWAILESGDEIRIDQHVFVFELPATGPQSGPLAAGSPA